MALKFSLNLYNGIENLDKDTQDQLCVSFLFELFVALSSQKLQQNCLNNH
jgi:hypothetical protein